MQTLEIVVIMLERNQISLPCRSLVIRQESSTRLDYYDKHRARRDENPAIFRKKQSPKLALTSLTNLKTLERAQDLHLITFPRLKSNWKRKQQASSPLHFKTNLDDD